DAKVIQVIDGKKMLVAFRHSGEPGRRREGYGASIMLYCPTAGIADGKEYLAGSLSGVAKSYFLKVTGTEAYVATSGGRRTVFVLEPDFEARKIFDAAIARAREQAVERARLNAEREKKDRERAKKDREDRKQAEQMAKEDAQREAYLRYAKKLVDREDYAKAR